MAFDPDKYIAENNIKPAANNNIDFDPDKYITKNKIVIKKQTNSDFDSDEYIPEKNNNEIIKSEKPNILAGAIGNLKKVASGNITNKNNGILGELAKKVSPAFLPSSNIVDTLTDIPLKPKGAEDVSILGELAKGVAQGTLGIPKSIGEDIEFAGDVAPIFIDKIPLMNKSELLKDYFKGLSKIGRRTSDKFQEISNRYIPNDQQIIDGTWKDNPSILRAGVVIANALPSLLAGVGAGTVAKTGLKLSTKSASLASAAGLSALETNYQNAKDSIIAQGVSEEDAVKKAALIATANMIVNTGLEYMPLEKFVGGGKGQPVFKSILDGMISEGMTETAQQFSQNIVAKVGYDKARDLTDGLVDSFIGGAGSGGIIGGITSNIGKNNVSETKKQENSSPEDNLNLLKKDFVKPEQNITKITDIDKTNQSNIHNETKSSQGYENKTDEQIKAEIEYLDSQLSPNNLSENNSNLSLQDRSIIFLRQQAMEELNRRASKNNDNQTLENDVKDGFLEKEEKKKMILTDIDDLVEKFSYGLTNEDINFLNKTKENLQNYNDGEIRNIEDKIQQITDAAHEKFEDEMAKYEIELRKEIYGTTKTGRVKTKIQIIEDRLNELGISKIMAPPKKSPAYGDYLMLPPEIRKRFFHKYNPNHIGILYDEAEQILQEQDSWNSDIWEYFHNASRSANLDYMAGRYRKQNPNKNINADFVDSSFEYLKNAKPIIELTGKEFQKDGIYLIDKVSKFYKDNYNGQIFRDGIGNILLDRNSVSDSLGHGMSALKASAYAAVPKVIKQGKIVNEETNWKNKGYDSVLIVAPIQIGKDSYVCEVVVKKSKDFNRFYLHEVKIKNSLKHHQDRPNSSGSISSRNLSIEHINKFVNRNKLTDLQIEEIKKINRKLFGDENVGIVEKIITEDGQQALGRYLNGIIDIVDGKADYKGTYYHEAVHKYLDLFTTEKEKKAIFAYFVQNGKNRKKTDIEETLAENFIVYAKNRESLTGRIKLLFDRILLRIQRFLDRQDIVKQIYSDILSGQAKIRRQMKSDETTKYENRKKTDIENNRYYDRIESEKSAQTDRLESTQDVQNVVDLTDIFKDLQGKSKSEILKIAEARLKEIAGIVLDTASSPFQIQVVKDNITDFNLKTENKIKGIKNKVHKSSLAAFDKIVKHAIKYDDQPVDLTHNTSKKTIKHKKQVERYVYFNTKVGVQTGDNEYSYYTVKIVAERIKGQNTNLLDLYNIEIGKPRSTSVRTNSSEANVNITQNVKKVNNKITEQDKTKYRLDNKEKKQADLLEPFSKDMNKEHIKLANEIIHNGHKYVLKEDIPVIKNTQNIKGIDVDIKGAGRVSLFKQNRKIPQKLLQAMFDNELTDLSVGQANGLSTLAPIRATEVIDGKRFGLFKETFLKPIQDADKAFNQELSKQKTKADEMFRGLTKEDLFNIFNYVEYATLTNKEMDEIFGDSSLKEKEEFLDYVKKLVNKELPYDKVLQIVKQDKENFGITRIVTEEQFDKLYGHIAKNMLLSNNKNIKKISEVGDWIKLQYDDFIDRLNVERETIGKDKVLKRNNYITHLMELNAVDEILQYIGMNFTDVPASMLSISMYTKPNSPFFKFAKPRQGIKTQRDAKLSYMTYLEPVLKNIHFTRAIKNARDILEYRVETFGQYEGVKPEKFSIFGMMFPNAYQYFTDYLNSVAGKREWLDKKQVRLASILGETNKLFSVGSIGGNLSTAITQFLSLRNTVAETGIFAIKGALRYSTSEGRLFYKRNSRIGAGRSYEPAMISDRLLGSKLLGTKHKQLSNILSFLISFLDHVQVGTSFLAGYEQGKYMGLSDQEAVRYGDDVAERTQSSGNLIDRPPVNRGKIKVGFNQFNTFVYNEWSQLKNDILKAIIKSENSKQGYSKIGLGSIKSNSRAKGFGRAIMFITMTAVLSNIYDALGLPNNLKLDDDDDDFGFLKTIINYLLNSIPGLSTVRFGGSPFIKGGYNLIMSLVGDGNEKKRAIKQLQGLGMRLIPAGGQISKTGRGIAAMWDNGVVRNGKNEFMFRIDKNKKTEIARALLFGPYQTMAGKKYLEKRK